MLQRNGESQSVRGRDVDEFKNRAKIRARLEADRQSERLKQQVGEYVLEAVEELFPEQYQARRRNDVAKAFVVGLLAGLIGRELLRLRNE